MIDNIVIGQASDYSDVVSIDVLKTHLRVLHNDENTLIGAYRDAACEWVQQYCGIRLAQTAVTIRTNRWGIVELPIAPIDNLTSVKYKTGADDTLTTLPVSEYTADLNRVPALIKFHTSRSTHSNHIYPIEINLSCGYGDDAVPFPIVQAIKFLVAHFYENREQATIKRLVDVPFGVQALLNPYRIISFL